jgi:hypothetical protein
MYTYVMHVEWKKAAELYSDSIHTSLVTSFLVNGSV